MIKRILLLVSLLFFFSTAAYGKTTITGILPLHGGYSYLGLAICGEIFSVLSKTQIYTAVILLGFVYMVFCGMRDKNLNPFLVYFITVAFIGILFFGKQSIIGTPKSYAEEKGDTLYTAADVVEEHNTSLTASAPRGLLWFNKAEDAIVHLILNAVNNVTSKEGEGFFDGEALSYIWAKEFVDSMAIGDKELAGRLYEFTYGPFREAGQKFKKAGDDGELSVFGYSEYEYPSWPGDGVLTGESGKGKGFYTSEQKEEWSALRDDLYEYALSLVPEEKITKHKHWWEKLNLAIEGEDAKGLGSVGTYGKNEVVKKLFNNSKGLLDLTASTISEIEKGKGGKESSWLTQGLILVFTKIGAAFLRGAMVAFPMMQAYFLMLALGLFPVVLLICLLPFPGQQVRILFTYFMSLLWLKSWTITTCLAANFSQIGWSTNSWLAGQMIPFLTCVLMLLGPVIMWGIIMSGSLAGASAIGGAIGGIASGAGSIGEGAGRSVV